MVNLSTWFAELLFAVVHASFSLAEPPVEKSDQNTNLTILQGSVITKTPATTKPPPVPPTISIVTLKPDPSPTPKPPVCNIDKIDSGKYIFADCKNKNLAAIPKDFGDKNYPLIKILDLSNNNFKNLTTTDLYNFTALTELVMKNIPDLHSFPKDFFLHLQYLEKLDVSGTPITDFGELNIYLHTLNGTNIQATNVNLSHLVSLHDLQLNNNPKLTRFPLLSLTTPLKHLDIRFSSMIDLTYADLAPFCLLQYFGLESSELEKASNASQCCYIKNWTTFFQIPGSEKQKCGAGDPCSKINSTLSLDVIAVRNECLKRTGFLEFLKKIVQIFVGVVVASGVIYFICYNYFFSHGKKKHYDDYDTNRYAYDANRYYVDDTDYADDDDDDDGGNEEEYQYYY